LTSEIRKAAEIIRAGGLVAFPTETVYGLGANALNETAVEKIYRAKGRPSESPLIVHAADTEMARSLVTGWPAAAAELAGRYWPGPLTLVLPKAAHVPDRVTAGLPTVGVRVPAHPVALALIREAGVPIAAPSANRFTELSPTEARHIDASLADFVLDGGASEIGIESTVISLTGDRPLLLRPGVLAIEDTASIPSISGAHPSPGMHERHYAPRTRLILGNAPLTGRGFEWTLPGDPTTAARTLYATLHELDRMNLDWIAVTLPPDTPKWAGVRDRLKRAAS
jgi:L-threonylcarbamoyladenylate synthase